MSRSVTALVTGVGGGVGQSIMKGLNLATRRRNDVDYRIVGVDADPAASGLFRADAGYTVPLANEDGYVDRLVEIARAEDADVVVPGSDPEVYAIAQDRSRIADEAAVEVLVSSAASVEIGRDKYRTHEFLHERGFETPDTVLAPEVEDLVDRVGFPLVVKPRYGSASRGMFVVTDREELDHALAHSNDEIVVQEYLIPEDWEDQSLTRADLERQIDEYSTETIVDGHGEVVHSLSNWREMDKGVPSVAKVRPHEEVREACESVAEHLDVLGPVNLQARVTDAGVSFFEINTRFTGSTAVRCTAGFNGPDSMIRHLVFDEPVERADLEFENLVEIRFKNEVYLDEETFDEIVSSGRVEGGGEIQDYF